MPVAGLVAICIFCHSVECQSFIVCCHVPMLARTLGSTAGVGGEPFVSTGVAVVLVSMEGGSEGSTGVVVVVLSCPKAGDAINQVRTVILARWSKVLM